MIRVALTGLAGKVAAAIGHRSLWAITAVLVAVCGFIAFTPPHSAATHLVNDGQDRVTVKVIFPTAEGAPGLLHYTEHLAWLNAIGGARSANQHSNAWTSSHAVAYWLSGTTDDLPQLLTRLKRIFDPIELPETFALEERDIVLREYDFALAGNPTAQASEEMNAFLYEGSLLGRSIIGTRDEIRSFTYESAMALHAATHQPGKATLIVTGDLSNRQLQRALRKAEWPDIPREAQTLAPIEFEPEQRAERVFTFANDDATPRLIWRRVVDLPERMDFDRLEAHTALLRDILDTNLPGGLAGPLRFDAPVARHFNVNIWPIDDNSIEISFSATPETGVQIADLQEAFETTLAQLAEGGIPQETYDRVLGRFDDFWPNWEDTDETADWMAGYVIDRASFQREPLDQSALKALDGDFSYVTTNLLLSQFVTDGRTAIAFIGPKDTF